MNGPAEGAVPIFLIAHHRETRRAGAVLMLMLLTVLVALSSASPSRAGVVQSVSATSDARGVTLKIRVAGGLEGASSFALATRSEEHTSELQSLMRTSYSVFCLQKKNTS